MDARPYLAAWVSLLVMLPGIEASADRNDIILSRFGTQQIDGADVVTGILGHNHEFRAFASELGMVLAPRVLHGADTTGFGGFEFTVDAGQTSISHDKSYWRVLESSTNPGAGDGSSHGASQLRTVGLFARKGLWFPAPGAEIGLGGVHVQNSGMYAGQAYLKFALYEGFHDSPVPSIALRLAGSRLYGAQDLDLTVGAIDVTISKHLGIAGTFRVDPYFNYGLVFIVPRSQVLEGTPNIDPLDPGSDADNNLNFVLRDQNAIVRQRAEFGLRFELARFTATAAVDYAPQGRSRDNAPSTNAVCTAVPTTNACDSVDASASQVSVFISAGIAL
ncbi:MAG: hypothetical protein IPL79_09525 [Myxococcales bacterium]|nr:hypothetical protein [Myxococcales bacterium]